MLCLNLNHLPSEAACSLAVWNYRSGIPADPHTHTFYELFWVESGEGYHWFNGAKRWMTPGYLALIRPKDAHAFSASVEGGHVCFSNFSCRPSVWERIRKRYFYGAACFFAEPDDRKREVMLEGRDIERLRHLAGDLHAGFHDTLTGDAFLIGLFSLLLNQEKRRRRATSIPAWLASACETVRIYPHFKEGVHAFVKNAGRSAEHVARECRRHLGKTPRELVNEARLDYVASQLCTSNQPLLDIAFEAGFENIGHFYHLFRLRFARSPHQYRVFYASKAGE